MAEASVGYVLKGYPRRSELFIASEIWRLEQRGVALRLFVLKPADETARHPVVDRISAEPSYLPATTSLSGQPVLRWLRQNLGSFRPALLRVARRHPMRLLRTAVVACGESIRARRGLRPRKTLLKEFLQAVDLADRLSTAADVRHLHAHFAHGTTTVTWLAAMLCRLPFSFTGHAKDIYRESLNPAGLLPRKMRAATFVVTCTGANVEHLRQLEPTAVVHLVHHGLNADFATLRPTLQRRPRPADRLRVVAVGRLVPKKGFDTLVDAVGRLSDVDLAIAGEDGPAADAVRRLAARRCPGRVRFVGPVSQEELLSLYGQADVFALACRVDADGDRDGIPNVLVEAMAAGLPVVSTRVSGIPELVRDGENGLLVAPEDPAALAAALARLGADPALRDRLAAGGRATVAAHFDGDRLADRMASLFPGGAR